MEYKDVFSAVVLKCQLYAILLIIIMEISWKNCNQVDKFEK